MLLDAATAAVARKGDAFLAKWADIMTGKLIWFYVSVETSSVLV